MQGWVKVYRQILDNPLWEEKPFTKGQAWVDLLLLANYEDSSFRKRGVSVTVLEGEVGRSEVELSDRWGWSRNKVRRYLKCLENDGQITKKKAEKTIQQNGTKTEQQNKFVTSLYSITNWKKYQGNGTANDTADRTHKRSKEVKNKNICVPLKDKTEFLVTEKMIEEWQEAFSKIDVLQQLKNLSEWNKSNPSKRKTKTGIRRHINFWLSSANDKIKSDDGWY